MGQYKQRKFKKTAYSPKNAIRMINNKTRFDHNAELFKPHEILNLFELEVFNIAIFM